MLQVHIVESSSFFADSSLLKQHVKLLGLIRLGLRLDITPIVHADGEMAIPLVLLTYTSGGGSIPLGAIPETHIVLLFLCPSTKAKTAQLSQYTQRASLQTTSLFIYTSSTHSRILVLLRQSLLLQQRIDLLGLIDLRLRLPRLFVQSQNRKLHYPKNKSVPIPHP